ncbi:hypothetical protein V3N99_08680 [Dermatophilaceae bacterium Soc4.6]
MFLRKRAKRYGSCRLAEGLDVSQRRGTLIEDVLTTGGAVRAAIIAQRDLDATVSAVVCVIDRSGQPEGPLTDVGVETRAVLTKADLDDARAHQAG